MLFFIALFILITILVVFKFVFYRGQRQKIITIKGYANLIMKIRYFLTVKYLRRPLTKKVKTTQL